MSAIKGVDCNITFSEYKDCGYRVEGPLHDKTAWFEMLGTLMLLILLIITKLRRNRLVKKSCPPNSPIVQFDTAQTQSLAQPQNG